MIKASITGPMLLGSTIAVIVLAILGTLNFGGLIPWFVFFFLFLISKQESK